MQCQGLLSETCLLYTSFCRRVGVDRGYLRAVLDDRRDGKRGDAGGAFTPDHLRWFHARWMAAGDAIGRHVPESVLGAGDSLVPGG